ncbi:inversin-like isoform X1 [Lingula anatina]|uniref:Inversin-like isoform X1 n=3 Tax=Lingula anatina TaxID=7574 RepID=A0A2R2MLF2_LINAN|nr:inversin-like isoform X1 [Lingula anatina]|eukprot:XP_023931035.1 inversin-like isoform X1 [Lingula anatina]
MSRHGLCLSKNTRVAPVYQEEMLEEEEEGGSQHEALQTGVIRKPLFEVAVIASEHLQKMAAGPFDRTSPVQPEGSTTKMHAAAVNGDKATLARLLTSNAKDIDTGDQFGRTPLMFCVLADRLDCAELLLKAGAHLDKKDKGGRSALHWAAHKGNFRCMKLLLSKNANWKEKDNEGQTALHLCTRHKSPKCLALLLKQVAPGEVDDQDKNKRTALHWSASYGNLEHIKMLIKQDANIGIPDVEGKTPLHWAASSRDAEAVSCVNLLLDMAGSVINWQDYEGRTALHLAVADGNYAVVDALISLEKCNVSALDNMFRTPLHWAAVLGHSKIVELLLSKKADYASSDSNGATPLHYAAQNNFADTVEVFLRHKGVTDEPDVERRTAFMWASGKGADDVIKVFIKYGADLQQVDKNGGTAMHAAALSGHVTTVNLLLEYKAPIDAEDLVKHTPLFRACEMGHTDVVQTLIDYGAKVEIYDQDGRSPLHWAALGGHAYICQTVIKYGIDPNIRDHSGRTPLQCAAYGGYVNCMSVLIENQADPNAQDNEGMTALHWACSKGHLDAVKLLLEFHAFPNHMEFTEDRYTPLDYALMGEHREVSQFMIEQGALSINGIQELAACKIQSNFRGYRVRKTFLERKKLLMKHEQLRKDAAKKRAEEEYRRKEDIRNKREVEERRKTELGEGHSKSSRRKREPQLSEEERILLLNKQNRQIVSKERDRLSEFRRKEHAARVIQRAWKHYVFRFKGVMKSAADAIKSKRLKAGEEEWKRQIAALTIQLAWRKFYRKKLLTSLTGKSKRVLHMWDPEVVAAKQRMLMEQIYTEHIEAVQWFPRLEAPVRPLWFKYMPSAAALSFNFAVDQYDPELLERSKTQMEFEDDLPFGLQEDFRNIHLSGNPQHFSYNMYEV